MRIRSSRSPVAYIVNLKPVWDTDLVSKSKEVSPKAKNFITTLVGPRLKRQQHEEYKFKASLGHITNPEAIITIVITTLKTKQLQVFDYCPKYCLVVKYYFNYVTVCCVMLHLFN